MYMLLSKQGHKFQPQAWDHARFKLNNRKQNGPLEILLPSSLLKKEYLLNHNLQSKWTIYIYLELHLFQKHETALKFRLGGRERVASNQMSY